MLTRELAIAAYESGAILPDRLTRGEHAHYQQFAERMIAVYRSGVGHMRQQLHHAIHAIFDDELNCPTRRIDAFCKLLDEKSTYDQDKRGAAAKLRQRVFRRAAERHPLVENADSLFESSERETKAAIAAELGMSWPEIERSLFSDVIQFHRLASFEADESATSLLAKYNVAQTQAVLYDAVSMTVWADQDFKRITRYAKLARLMHTIERTQSGGYVFRLDGPMSTLKTTRRYGIAFAKFLPALLSCSGWKMRAVIQHRRSNRINRFQLSPADGLTSHLKIDALFDSDLEQKFFENWGTDPRQGWTLIHEGEILHRDQKVFVPDFVFQHASGTRVMMEVVGFWTPEYIANKRQTLDAFPAANILLVVADSIDWPETRAAANPFNPATTLVRYKTTIKVNDVLQALNSRL